MITYLAPSTSLTLPLSENNLFVYPKANITITLPSPQNLNSYRIFSSSHTALVNSSSGNIIFQDGSSITSFTMGNNGWIDIVSDGANWIAVTSEITNNFVIQNGKLQIDNISVGSVTSVGQSEFSYGIFSDPQIGVARDAKFGNLGIAVSGGIFTDTLDVSTRPTFNNAIPWDSLNLPNPLQSTGGSVTGNINFFNEIANISSGYNSTGLTIGWNHTSGQGEVDLLLGPQGGSGGLNIYQLNVSGSIIGSAIFTLSNTGNVSIPGSLATSGLTVSGIATALTPASGNNSTEIATTAFVNSAISAIPINVTSFDGRTGAVTLEASDIDTALGYTPANPATVIAIAQGGTGATSASAALLSLGAASSTQIGNLLGEIEVPTSTTLSNNSYGYAIHITGANIVTTLPVSNGNLGDLLYFYTSSNISFTITCASSQFIWSNQIGLSSSTGPTNLVVSNGASVLLMSRGNGEYDVIGGTILLSQNTSPTFTNSLTTSGISILGLATAPTPSTGDNSTKIATTAFVDNAINAIPSNVISFNGRNGTVTLTSSDVTGALTYTPVNPSANTTFYGLVSFSNSLGGTTQTLFPNTGLTVGWNYVSGQGEVDLLLGPQGGSGGLNIYQLNSSGQFVSTTPILALSHTGNLTLPGTLSASSLTASNLYITGTATAPTPSIGDNSTKIATTAFVDIALNNFSSQVTSFNSRTGAITLTSSDVISALNFTPLPDANPVVFGNLQINEIFTVSGGNVGSGFSSQVFGPNSTNPAESGRFYIAWNATSGQGETDFILAPQTLQGGLNIYFANSAGNCVNPPVFQLESNGNLELSGSLNLTSNNYNLTVNGNTLEYNTVSNGLHSFYEGGSFIGSVSSSGFVTPFNVQGNKFIGDVSSSTFLAANTNANTPISISTFASYRNNIKSYGAIGDGNSHQISTVTNFNGTNTTNWTLTQWQTIYPFATALTNQIDNLALILACENTSSVYFPPGNYVLNMLTQLGTVSLYGDSYLNTTITLNSVASIEIYATTTTTTAVQCDVHGLSFIATNSAIALNIYNNTPLSSYGVGAGINRCTIRDCYFQNTQGPNTTYAVVQLYNVNTSNIIGCFFLSFVQNSLAITGQSVANQIDSCFFNSIPESVTTNILIDGMNSSVGIQGVQVVNTGINGGYVGIKFNANIDDVTITCGGIDSCIHPFLVTSTNSNANTITNLTIYGWYGGLNIVAPWTPNTPVNGLQPIAPTVANGYAYSCTVSGTTGTTQPNWPLPTSGDPTPTVSDGTATWILQRPYIQPTAVLEIDGASNVAVTNCCLVNYGNIGYNGEQIPNISFGSLVQTCAVIGNQSQSTSPVFMINEQNVTNLTSIGNTNYFNGTSFNFPVQFGGMAGQFKAGTYGQIAMNNASGRATFEINDTNIAAGASGIGGQLAFTEGSTKYWTISNTIGNSGSFIPATDAIAFGYNGNQVMSINGTGELSVSNSVVANAVAGFTYVESPVFKLLLEANSQFISGNYSQLALNNLTGRAIFELNNTSIANGGAGLSGAIAFSEGTTKYWQINNVIGNSGSFVPATDALAFNYDNNQIMSINGTGELSVSNSVVANAVAGLSYVEAPVFQLINNTNSQLTVGNYSQFALTNTTARTTFEIKDTNIAAGTSGIGGEIAFSEGSTKYWTVSNTIGNSGSFIPATDAIAFGYNGSQVMAINGTGELTTSNSIIAPAVFGSSYVESPVYQLFTYANSQFVAGNYQQLALNNTIAGTTFEIKDTNIAAGASGIGGQLAFSEGSTKYWTISNKIGSNGTFIPLSDAIAFNYNGTQVMAINGTGELTTSHSIVSTAIAGLQSIEAPVFQLIANNTSQISTGNNGQMAFNNTASRTFLEIKDTHLASGANGLGASIVFEQNSTNYWQIVNNVYSTGSYNPGSDVLNLIYNNTYAATFYGTGNLNIAGSLSQSSDINLKTNISKSKGIEIVKQLNGVEFDWKDKEGHNSGVIAQEIEKVLPHLVHDNDGTKSVNYIGIIPYLIESIKELNEKIDKLTNH